MTQLPRKHITEYRIQNVTDWGLPIYPPPFKLAQTLPTPKLYADLPLVLLGAPVDIGALVKTWVTVSGSEHTNAKSVTCL
jgi:hypothetical protein